MMINVQNNLTLVKVELGPIGNSREFDSALMVEMESIV
jgi:hypothetical protein